MTLSVTCHLGFVYSFSGCYVIPVTVNRYFWKKLQVSF